MEQEDSHCHHLVTKCSDSEQEARVPGELFLPIAEGQIVFKCHDFKIAVLIEALVLLWVTVQRRHQDNLSVPLGTASPCG